MPNAARARRQPRPPRDLSPLEAAAWRRLALEARTAGRPLAAADLPALRLAAIAVGAARAVLASPAGADGALVADLEAQAAEWRRLFELRRNAPAARGGRRAR